MNEINFLYKFYDSDIERFGTDFYSNRVSKDILNNLNPKFETRQYQKEAFGRFSFYMSDDNKKKDKPIHLMFNMATGSGKTLIMAGLLIDLYKRGYTNFIFFVRSTSIITKTKDNFLNELHEKYLFNSKIIVNGNEIKIKEVSNFDITNKSEISIMFTTTAQLHIDLNTAKENKTSYDDLKDKKIVLIADEAHNLQADILKKKNKAEEEESNSWQATARRILNLNQENILLEFTATARLNDERVANEYQNKVLFRYDLKAFREEGYSKDVDVLQINSSLMDRTMASVILSQYRRKVAEKYKLAVKPVILFKANQVSIPKDIEKLKGDNPKVVVSSLFKESFHNLIDSLNTEKINAIANIENDELKKAFAFFTENKITIDNLIAEIKTDFAKEFCISADDEKEIEKYQREINNLENNEYRAVFATEKLNEGWDVLNLYDIVRLYDTRDAKDNEAGQGTVMEAQLIGRGARYNPFRIKDSDDKFKRKFDDNADNELRILERLFYHSAQNVKYVQELRAELDRQGITSSDKITRHLNFKEDFKNASLWKDGFVFKNERKLKSFNQGLFEDLANRIKKQVMPPFNLKSGESSVINVFEDEEIVGTKPETMTVNLIDLDFNVIRHALAKLNICFKDINNFFSDVLSVDEFIAKEQYLSDLKITFQGEKRHLENLTQKDKVNGAIYALKTVFEELKNSDNEYEGTTEFTPHKISSLFENRTLILGKDSPRAKEFEELSLIEEDWYAQNEIWGTPEEQSLLLFISSVVDDLKKKYAKVSVIRNERFLEIYSFDEGHTFEPDFLLFLEENSNDKILYQIFIEPKGNQFKDSDGTFINGKEGWKEKFLLQIEEKYKINPLFKIENKDFKLVGLPFYNKDSESDFIELFNKKFIKSS